MIRPTPFAAIILAAGKGTRMKSDVHKVLHPIAGRAMLDNLMGVLEGLGPARKIVVVGSGREQVEGAGRGARRRGRGPGARSSAPPMPFSRPRRAWPISTATS